MFKCYFYNENYICTDRYALLQLSWIPCSQNVQRKFNTSKLSVTGHCTTHCETLYFWVTRFNVTLTLKIQGISFRFAWMTSEAKTELTENSSSLMETTNVIGKELERGKAVCFLLIFP